MMSHVVAMSVNAQIENVSISSSALGETLNSAASVDVLVAGSFEGPSDSWKDGKDATTLRLMRAESSTSLDMSINYSQLLDITNRSIRSSQSSRHTPAIADVKTFIGLNNRFVVGSAFRRQMWLKQGKRLILPPFTWHERDVIQRPPAFNAEYKVTENGGQLSTLSAIPRDGSQTTTSSVCGGCSPRTSSTESMRPTFNVNQPITGNTSHVTQVNLLPVNMKPTFRISSDRVDDVDDDVFHNEDNTSDAKCSAALPAAVSTTRVKSKSVGMVFIHPLTMPSWTTKRISSYSVQGAYISKSVPSPVDDIPVTSQSRLYPVLPQRDLLTSSMLGRLSLPIRVSRIAVCPISGDVMIIDKKQSLIQFYTSGGRLESCTEIEAVSGACFLHQYDHRRVAVSCTEPRGVVELYYRAGPILIREDCFATIGPTLNVITYRHGLIAVQTKRLLIFSVQPCDLQLQRTISEYVPGGKPWLSSKLLYGRHRSCVASKPVQFIHITDCSASKSGDIIVLDTHILLVLSPDGKLIRSTDNPLLKPHPMSHVMRTLAVDFRSGAIVCCPETRRVMQFDTNSSKCPLHRILLEMRSCSGRNDSRTALYRPVESLIGQPTCIAVDTTHGRLFVAVLIDGKRSEVNIYQLQQLSFGRGSP